MNASDTCLTEWDKLLNNYYQLLKEELSYDQFIVVRESQRKWLVYREEELGFLASNLPEGMIYREIYFGRRTSIVKERVEELQHIYSMIPDLSKMHLIEFPGIRAIGWE